MNFIGIILCFVALLAHSSAAVLMKLRYLQLSKLTAGLHSPVGYAPSLLWIVGNILLLLIHPALLVIALRYISLSSLSGMAGIGGATASGLAWCCLREQPPRPCRSLLTMLMVPVAVIVTIMGDSRDPSKFIPTPSSPSIPGCVLRNPTPITLSTFILLAVAAIFLLLLGVIRRSTQSFCLPVVGGVLCGLTILLKIISCDTLELNDHPLSGHVVWMVLVAIIIHFGGSFVIHWVARVEDVAVAMPLFYGGYCVCCALCALLLFDDLDGMESWRKVVYVSGVVFLFFASIICHCSARSDKDQLHRVALHPPPPSTDPRKLDKTSFASQPSFKGVEMEGMGEDNNSGSNKNKNNNHHQQADRDLRIIMNVDRNDDGDDDDDEGDDDDDYRLPNSVSGRRPHEEINNNNNNNQNNNNNNNNNQNNNNNNNNGDGQTRPPQRSSRQQLEGGGIPIIGSRSSPRLVPGRTWSLWGNKTTAGADREKEEDRLKKLDDDLSVSLVDEDYETTRMPSFRA